MIKFSQNEQEAIAAYSVGKELETFRTRFHARYSTDEDANVAEVIDQITSEAFDRGEWTTCAVAILLTQGRRRLCRA
jgi:hypothetical protein